MQNCFKTVIASWLEGSCDESESEIEVSDSTESCFRDASDTQTIYSVALDELLDWLFGWLA